MESSRIKKLGCILHFTDLGHAIVRTKHKLPKIGSSVVNENLEHIGIVVDVFGPVKDPYVSIKLKAQFKDKMDSKIELYTIDKRQKNVRQSRRKKRYTK